MDDATNRIDRRHSLTMGAAVLAVGFRRRRTEPAAGIDDTQMRYRPLGATGRSVSKVSFGAHGVDNQHLIGAALDAGLTTFATSGNCLGGGAERYLSSPRASPSRRGSPTPVSVPVAGSRRIALTPPNLETI